jgi:serine/threonine-protein kinase HipA
MTTKRCLYCYQPLDDFQADFHAACSKKIFGKPEPPTFDFTEDQMLELAEKVIKSQVAVTGVQPKLSLDIEKVKKNGNGGKSERFTIVGLWGGYILKPPTTHYPHLPELEDVTMHLATIAGIATVPHSLIRLTSGKLAYITKRIDRTKEGKLHMEDMCQLTERLTEHKYKGSYEQIAKAIAKYSANPGLDKILFFEQVVFSFLTGNADMHLKNFSLTKRPNMGYVLSPAYDMVASALVVQGDEEELALNLNGKKKNIKRSDFQEAFKTIDERARENVFKKFHATLSKWYEFIEISFLPDEMKQPYIQLIKERAHRMELI